MTNAVQHVLLAGIACAGERDEALVQIDTCPGEHFVALLGTRNLKFRGLYCVDMSGRKAYRLCGEGPAILPAEDVSVAFKYDSAGRRFRELTTHGFTASTDACCLGEATRKP